MAEPQFHRRLESISALGFLAIYGYRGKQKAPLRKEFPLSKGLLMNRRLPKSLHRKNSNNVCI